MTVSSMALLDTTSTQFEQFMAQATHNPTPVTIQIETTVAQDDSISTLVTTYATRSCSFSLPPWHSAIILKKKDELPPEDHDFRQVTKTNALKRKNEKYAFEGRGCQQ